MSRNQKTNILLWTAQLLLAALFLFAGSTKFIMPPEMLQGPVPIPLGFIYFIGVAEIAGAIGLILPGVLHIRRSLTPLAALGLVPIMTGATVVTIEGGMAAGALVPLVIGIIAAAVAYGRRDWAPLAWQ
jgi:uncharacterized membrane protein YphA (DoxX/SURF4 family)